MAADPTIPRRGQSVTRAQLALNRAAGLKRCFSCKETMAVEFFSVDKSRPDGRQPKCKGCYSKYHRNRGRASPTPADQRYPDGIKVCSRCGEPKPLDQFDEVKIPKWDYRKMCRPCWACHRAECGEKENRRKVAWKKANPEWIVAYQKSWDAANREARDEIRRRSNHKHREKRAATAKAYRLKNAEIFRTAWHKKRARRLQAPGHHTAADVIALRAVQKNRCAHPWCRVSLASGYHVDHIMPLIRGGTNDRRNLQLLCAPCNLKKHAKHPVDVALAHGMLV